MGDYGRSRPDYGSGCGSVMAKIKRMTKRDRIQTAGESIIVLLLEAISYHQAMPVDSAET